MQYAALLVAVAATALALGCQQAPTPPVMEVLAAPAPHLSPALSLKAEGDALAAKADPRAAAEVYARAAVLDPDDMSIRLALGTALSFLDQKRDTIEAFRTVVARGDPGSVEYREAKRWLEVTGVVVAVESLASGPGKGKRTGPDAAAEQGKIVGGRLVGRMEWPGIDPAVRSVRGELWIYGAEPLTEGVKRQRPISLGGYYAFDNIPAGQYRIMARLFGAPNDVTLWDQKVMVEDGRSTELVLTPGTALVSPDKFPPPPASQATSGG